MTSPSTAVDPGGVDGRRTPRQRRSRATVDAVLDAADRLVAEGGVDGVGAAALAEAAGVAVGTVYQYFDGVEGVVAALAARKRSAFARDLAAQLAAGDLRRKRDAANAALDLAVARCRADAAFRNLWRDLPEEGEGAGPVVVGAVVDALVAAGLARRDDPGFVREAEVQWAVAQALVRLAFRRHPEGDVVVLDHLRRLFDLDVTQR